MIAANVPAERKNTLRNITPNGLVGIKFTSRINENDFEGTIYDVAVGENIMQFALTNGPEIDECKSKYGYIVASLRQAPVSQKVRSLLLTRDETIISSCFADFNIDESDQTVTHVNADKDFQVEIPYNASWGSLDYRILPFEQVNDDQVIYGPLGSYEACAWIRLHSIHFTSVRGIQTILDEMNSYDMHSTHPGYPKLIEHNGLQGVEYFSGGMCDSAAIEVVGEKYNYILNGGCSETFDELEEMFSTVKIGLEQAIFDGCGNVEKYQNETWYADFYDAFTDEVGSEKKIQELCFAPNENLVIFAEQPIYCGESHVGRYDTQTKLIELATYTNAEGDGCEAWPTAFGKRVGDVIEMTGSNGDAGCGADVAFDYNYVKNEYRKKSIYGYCYNGLTGEKDSESWNYY